MPSILDLRTRAGVLVLCAGLVGGTGCFTMQATNNDQLAGANKLQEEARRAMIDKFRVAALRNDPASRTLLGLEYLANNTVTGRDVPKGMILVEQAVAEGYGPAEYALGVILTQSAPFSNPQSDLPSDPVRGLALLKQSATRACEYGFPTPFNHSGLPANLLRSLYAHSKSLPQAAQQADLWLGRALVHCQRFSASFVRNLKLPTTGATPEDQTETLAWLELLPSADVQRNVVIKSLVLADVTAADRRTAQLRQMVADSERQYPAPAQPKIAIQFSPSP